ncbi:MAG: transporter [Steroidobacteraceae bacterium]|jgi:hypothetical protein|nr:transporter [Steroidobacteraceae bacterium]
MSATRLAPSCPCVLYALALCAAAWSVPSGAQQLEPRAFAPNPTGVSFVSLSTGWTEGDVLADASSPIQDFEIEYSDVIAGYVRSFAMGSRLASASFIVPYITGEATGLVNGEPARAPRSGPGDLRMRFTLNLLPGSALDPASFARAAPDRTLGFSVTIAAPTGEYYDDKLVNIGTNRWAVRPEFGGLRQFGRWTLDGSIAAWFYEDNDDYLGGSRRSQDPITVIQGHVSYTFAPRLWLGLGLTWYTGGESSVDGVDRGDEQDNTRAGLTLAVPVGQRHSVKLAWSTGTSARAGGDFDSLSLAWQFFWLD